MPSVLPTSDPGKTQDVGSFLQELLSEQQLLQTPVARFSEQADSLKTKRYTDLIPLSAPGPGEQYAFEVELDSCTGCKACVTACHSLNGLDEEETWRDIGLLVSAKADHPFMQTVTTACHHCADPGCLKGCPVLAYEKNPVTGIVKHLDDQCIGCSYCLLMCPFDVPKYNPSRGIVRKCDMCEGRLSTGEAPACAQACPTHAIRIVTVQTHVDPKGRRRVDTSDFLVNAPDPQLTQPTTRYISRRGLPKDLIAGDASSLQTAEAHVPLVVMLTLLEQALGALGAAACLGPAALSPFAALMHPTRAIATLAPSNALLLLAWISGLVGLSASGLHLGQPLRAWRVFLGLRHSWMSREIIALSGWFLAVCATLLLPHLATGVFAAGLAALFCSVMVYVATGRPSWRMSETLTRFGGGTVVLGLGALFAVVGGAQAAWLLGVAATAKVGFELTPILRARSKGPHAASARQASRLLLGPLKLELALRIGLGLAGGLVLPLLITTTGASPRLGVLAAVLLLAGEGLERVLFFRAVAAQKMPGLPCQ